MSLKALLIVFTLVFNIISTSDHVSIEHYEDHNSHCELCVNPAPNISQKNVLFSIHLLKERVIVLLTKNKFETEPYLLQFKRGPPKSFNT